MTRFLPTLLVALLTPALMAQECAGGRYYEPLFTEVLRTNAIAFGSNTGVFGNQQTLRMDVYQPVGDVLEERPVVLVAFGGSFITGTRNDVELLCREFAKRGYVAIAPDYRVGFFLPNPLSTMQAVMRGSHDMKACVRYLRRTVAEDGNPWHIDPDRIIIGGVSAGAISALHATYLNEDEEMPAILVPLSAELGGVEGNSGNPGYSSDVLACYSFSGAIGDTTWIRPGDQPLASIHEVGDAVVPYYTQQVYVVGQPTGLTASGSHDIHVHLEQAGLEHCLLTYPGNTHVGYLNTDAQNASNFIFAFCQKVVCGDAPGCGMLTVGSRELSRDLEFTVQPNPTQHQVVVQAPVAGRLQVFDVHGREVMAHRLTALRTTISVEHLPAGVYLLRLDAQPNTVLRLVKEE
jgi:para-nitrobenzyl esterase